MTCFLSNEKKVDLFFTPLNNIHPVLKFKQETETNPCLPFYMSLLMGLLAVSCRQYTENLLLQIWIPIGISSKLLNKNNLIN